MLRNRPVRPRYWWLGNPGGKLVSFPVRYWPVFGLGDALVRVLSIQLNRGMTKTVRCRL